MKSIRFLILISRFYCACGFPKMAITNFTLFSLPQGLPFFPLEIRGNLSNLPGVFEIYEAKEIKASKKK